MRQCFWESFRDMAVQGDRETDHGERGRTILTPLRRSLCRQIVVKPTVTKKLMPSPQETLVELEELNYRRTSVAAFS